MTDHRFTDINDDPPDPGAEPTEAELDAIAQMLADATVWDEPDPDVEDRVVAAIAAEARTARPGPVPATDQPLASPTPTAPPAPPNGRVIDARHRFRPVGIVLAAAAVVAVVAIGWGALRSSDPTGGQQVALAPTDLAPSDAQADLEVTVRPGGTQILLDVEGLPPAPDGFYYEAWMRKSPEVGVSIGTFHLRGGDTEIELWGGVLPKDYPIITVTIQQEGEGAASSGKVVLAGRIDN